MAIEFIEDVKPIKNGMTKISIICKKGEDEERSAIYIGNDGCELDMEIRERLRKRVRDMIKE